MYRRGGGRMACICPSKHALNTFSIGKHVMCHESRQAAVIPKVVLVAERACAYKAGGKKGPTLKHNNTPMSSSPSKPLDTPLQSPSQPENDNTTRPVSNSPRELVRRVVERTSDKLGRSKSLGSKSQQFPKVPNVPVRIRNFNALCFAGPERQRSANC